MTEYRYYVRKDPDEYLPWEDEALLIDDGCVFEELEEWLENAQTHAEETAVKSLQWARGVYHMDPFCQADCIERSKEYWRIAKDADW